MRIFGILALQNKTIYKTINQSRGSPFGHSPCVDSQLMWVMFLCIVQKVATTVEGSPMWTLSCPSKIVKRGRKRFFIGWVEVEIGDAMNIDLYPVVEKTVYY